MTTITNEYGTFSADTEAEALKLAKKGKRDGEKRARERAALESVALTRAEACGFRLLTLSNGIPRGWTVEDARAPGAYGPCWSHGTNADGDDVYEIETADGRGTFTLWHGLFRGAVMNGAGFVVAVLVKGHGTGATTEVYAVGVNEGVATFTRVPGLKPEQFRQRGAGYSSAALEAATA